MWRKAFPRHQRYHHNKVTSLQNVVSQDSSIFLPPTIGIQRKANPARKAPNSPTAPLTAPSPLPAFDELVVVGVAAAAVNVEMDGGVVIV